MNTIDGTEVLPGGNLPSLYAIGWGLARTARFAGQTKTWYSVLAHTFVVAGLVPDEYRLHALLHDAAESIIGDQVATWKNDMTKMDEDTILISLYESLGIQGSPYHPMSECYEVIRAADLAARSAEAELLGHTHANADYFVNIRNNDPALYGQAVLATKLLMDYCKDTITNTDMFAKEYEVEVREAIRMKELV